MYEFTTVTTGGDPAFPCDETEDHEGLTKREYFAIQILNGYICQGMQHNLTEEWAVKHADRLIEALNAPPKKQEPVT